MDEALEFLIRRIERRIDPNFFSQLREPDCLNCKLDLIFEYVRKAYEAECTTISKRRTAST